jgi:murein DD-endopeptidase MepM/ murein hydrolase activator NlpD
MLAPRRIKYYYDDKTCTFHKARFTPRWYLETFLTYGIFSIVALWGFSQIYQANFSTSKAVGLKEKNTLLIAELTQLNAEIAQYEAAVNDIYYRQNNLYAPIVGNPEINATIWESGTGGSPKYGRTDLSSITSIRLEKLEKRISLLDRGLTDANFKAQIKSEALSNMPSLMPVSGKLISGFGMRGHPIHGGGHMHTGLDFACKIGTPIFASGNGVVKATGTHESGYGLQVDIDHENSYVTKYAHLSRIAVSPGQTVKRGDVIGYSGNTGLSTGPHLHYEIIHNGTKIDPIDYFYSDLSPTSFLKKRLDAPAMDMHQEGQGN